MADFEALESRPNEERIAWIRKMSKGSGMMRIRTDMPLELFGADDWLHLVLIVTWIKYRMPRARSTIAILSALNLTDANRLYNGMKRDVPKTDLKDRRKELAIRFDVSERTVMRLEEEGAGVLDDYIERTVQPIDLEEFFNRWLIAETELRTLARDLPIRAQVSEVLEDAAEGMWNLTLGPDHVGRPYPRKELRPYIGGTPHVVADGNEQR